MLKWVHYILPRFYGLPMAYNPYTLGKKYDHIFELEVHDPVFARDINDFLLFDNFDCYSPVTYCGLAEFL